MLNSHPKLTGDALEQAVVDAALCRGTRSHRMDPIPAPPGTPRPYFGTIIVYRCEVCGTLRYDRVNRYTAEVYSRSYDHPEWYQAALAEKHEPMWWRALFYKNLPDEVFLDATPVTDIKSRRRVS
jgi:hypothetical protein